MTALRLLVLFSVLVSLAGAYAVPCLDAIAVAAVGQGRADADSPAPAEEPGVPSEAVDCLEETESKHLTSWSFTHQSAKRAAGLLSSGASPLDTSVPPLFPPPPNRA